MGAAVTTENVEATTGTQPGALSENAPKVADLLNDYWDAPSHTYLPPDWVNPATGSAFTDAELAGGITEAEVAGGMFSLATVGTVVLGGLAVYEAWKLSSPGGIIYKKLWGDPSPVSTSANVTTPSWVALVGSFSGSGMPAIPGTVMPAGAFILTANGGTASNFEQCISASGCTLPSDRLAFGVTAAAALASTSQTVPGTAGCATVAGSCAFIWRTTDQMISQLHVDDGCDVGCYGSATKQVDMTTTARPSLSPGTSGFQSALNKCGLLLGSGEVGTAEQEACRAWINHHLDPNWTPANPTTSTSAGNPVTIIGAVAQFTPFVIPEPQPTETYTDYLERLRAKGWVGTATVTVSGVDSPSTGPDGVISVQDTTTGAGPDAIAGWPANPFKVGDSGDSITVIVNSSGAASVPPSATPPGATSCSTGSLPSLDVTPLEGIDFGDKFPFGALTWAKDGVTGWGGSVAAPTFNAPLLGSYGGSGVPVDLGVLDPIMPLFREAILVVCTFGLFFGLATSFFGYRVWDVGEQGTLF